MPVSVFPAAAPEDLQVSSESVRDMITNIRLTHGLEMHSFLLLRKGSLIWEEYFREREEERLHVMWSVSKSFTSTAYGIAQDEGLFSLDDKLYDFFPEYVYACDSDWKREMTLRHILMMGSGFENRENEILNSPFEYEMVRKALEFPVIYKPGTVFNYYTLGTYLLSVVFSRVYPAGLHSYLREKLFAPLGIKGSIWNVDLNSVPLGGIGLYLRAKDMARMGQLYLQNGLWEQRQIVPQSYVREAVSKQIDNGPDTKSPLNTNIDWNAGYGYQFWRNSFGGFRADGMHGQYIVVYPQKDLVLVMTSRYDDMQAPLTAFKEILLPGIE